MAYHRKHFLFRLELNAKEVVKKRSAVEGDQGIEIASTAVKRAVEGDDQDDEKRAADKADDPEEADGDKEQDTHEFEGVAELV